MHGIGDNLACKRTLRKEGRHYLGYVMAEHVLSLGIATIFENLGNLKVYKN
jgi:hypothetical protein